jgi:hypothetical protein
MAGKAGNNTTVAMNVDELKNWLRAEVRALVGVQECVIIPNARGLEPALRLALWTGAIVNIYILTEVPRTRAVRGIVQQTTHEGIGVLFIVAPQLLPRHQQQLMPPEWMLALHALSNERLYTYPLYGKEQRLLQLHLERLNGTEQHQALYGPPVKLEKVHYGRVPFKPPYIKGSWLTAHFGRDVFWQADFQPRTNHRAPQQPRPSPGKPAWARTEKEKTPLERAYETLNVPANATYEEVKIAFRRQVFSVHPDVSALPKVVAEEKFRLLAEAFEFIKEKRGWS